MGKFRQGTNHRLAQFPLRPLNEALAVVMAGNIKADGLRPAGNGDDGTIALSTTRIARYKRAVRPKKNIGASLWMVRAWPS